VLLKGPGKPGPFLFTEQFPEEGLGGLRAHLFLQSGALSPSPTVHHTAASHTFMVPPTSRMNSQVFLDIRVAKDRAIARRNSIIVTLEARRAHSEY